MSRWRSIGSSATIPTSARLAEILGQTGNGLGGRPELVPRRSAGVGRAEDKPSREGLAEVPNAVVVGAQAAMQAVETVTLRLSRVLTNNSSNISQEGSQNRRRPNKA